MTHIIAWLVAIGGVSILAISYAMKLRTYRETRLERAANEFYKHLEILLDDDFAPDASFEVLNLLNHAIASRGISRMIFFALLRKNYSESKSQWTGIQDAIAYYDKKRSDLLEHFLGALVAGMFAMSY
jgi:hypothetical protein